MSEFKKGDTKKFLDYTIHYCVNNDGIVLSKKNDEPRIDYESHLGNYSTLEQAEKAAILYFMLARPERFATNIFYRVIGNGGCYHEFYTFKEVCKKEGIAIPDEVGPVDGINLLIGYKGEKITKL